ncbi:hypothetical protein NEMBOFW57_007078 [Staphylotrichum longicolle]|uniref:Uncharacterized protein n=1 Tax=Staphylotrichum longicolle TaxID=669026 RepID=A0AAD4HY34_9PEZI|nr:hypothetical protein NEMBOFW57_007078 [Staphylotrichum longicolle]
MAGVHPDQYCLHREVLLSLRFVLGRTRRSKALAKKLVLLLPSENRDPALISILMGDRDAMLVASPNDVPSIKQDFLTPWVEFPLLGERLLQIQKYNEQQKPSSTRAQFRDTRNPAQWYTLWAVLILGALGIILSFLQLGVAVAQLVFAVPRAGGEPSSPSEPKMM